MILQTTEFPFFEAVATFLGEYPLVTGKPAVFHEKPDHWSFAPIGEAAAAASVRVASFKEFELLVESVRAGGLPNREAEIARLRAMASPYPGQAAQRIIEVVAADYTDGPSPLVDPATIKTVAWERRPGTEPQED